MLVFLPFLSPRCFSCCDLIEKCCVSWKRNSFSDMLIFSWKLDESRKTSRISIWPSLWFMYITAHNLEDMHDVALIMTIDRLIFQGFKILPFEKLFKKCSDRYRDLIEKYQRSVKEIVNDSFPWYNLLYIQQDFSRVFIILHGFTFSCYWLDQFLTPTIVHGSFGKVLLDSSCFILLISVVVKLILCLLCPRMLWPVVWT